MSTILEGQIDARVRTIIAEILGNRGGGMHMPVLIEHTSRGERGFDPFSRLLQDRILYLGTPIDDEVANLVVALLLWLDNEDDVKPIMMHINSPGGVVSAGMAIYDTMHYINAPVSTYCVGQAASMAAVLLAAGAPGQRFVLPHAQVMIHQPLGGARGQATDVEIQARQIQRAKSMITEILIKHTGQAEETIVKDIERDFYLHGKDAVAYGIADEVIAKRPRRDKVRRGRGGDT